MKTINSLFARLAIGLATLFFVLTFTVGCAEDPSSVINGQFKVQSGVTVTILSPSNSTGTGNRNNSTGSNSKSTSTPGMKTNSVAATSVRVTPYRVNGSSGTAFDVPIDSQTGTFVLNAPVDLTFVYWRFQLNDNQLTELAISSFNTNGVNVSPVDAMQLNNGTAVAYKYDFGANGAVTGTGVLTNTQTQFGFIRAEQVRYNLLSIPITTQSDVTVALSVQGSPNPGKTVRLTANGLNASANVLFCGTFDTTGNRWMQYSATSTGGENLNGRKLQIINRTPAGNRFWVGANLTTPYDHYVLSPDGFISLPLQPTLSFVQLTNTTGYFIITRVNNAANTVATSAAGAYQLNTAPITAINYRNFAAGTDTIQVPFVANPGDSIVALGIVADNSSNTASAVAGYRMRLMTGGGSPSYPGSISLTDNIGNNISAPTGVFPVVIGGRNYAASTADTFSVGIYPFTVTEFTDALARTWYPLAPVGAGISSLVRTGTSYSGNWTTSTGQNNITFSFSLINPTTVVDITNLTSQVNGNNVTLNWTASGQGTNGTYRVTRSGTLVSANFTGTSFTDVGVPAGSYNYSVQANLTAGGQSTGLTVNVTVGSSTTPSATNLQFSNITNTSVTVSWTNGSASYTGITVTVGSQTFNLAGTATSVPVSGLTSGTNYSVSVTPTINGVNAVALTGQFTTLGGGGAAILISQLNGVNYNLSCNDPGFRFAILNLHFGTTTAEASALTAAGWININSGYTWIYDLGPNISNLTGNIPETVFFTVSGTVYTPRAGQTFSFVSDYVTGSNGTGLTYINNNLPSLGCYVVPTGQLGAGNLAPNPRP